MTENLVYDRTPADVERASALRRKVFEQGIDALTPEEKTEYLAGMKGAYNHTDMSRVGRAVQQIFDEMGAAISDLDNYRLSLGIPDDPAYHMPYEGSGASVNPKVDWTPGDVVTQTQSNQYLQDVATIEEMGGATEGLPGLPTSLNSLNHAVANDIEKTLDVSYGAFLATVEDRIQKIELEGRKTTKVINGIDKVEWDAPYSDRIPGITVGGAGKQKTLTGKNLTDVYGYSVWGISSINDTRGLANSYGTTINTIDKTDVLEVRQSSIGYPEVPSGYPNGYFSIGFDNRSLIGPGKRSIIVFDIDILENPLNADFIQLLPNGDGTVSDVAFLERPTGKQQIRLSLELAPQGNKQYIEVRNCGMSLNLSNFMIVAEGTTNFTYEPYTGGVSAPSPQYPTEPEFVTGASITNGTQTYRLPELKALPNGKYQEFASIQSGTSIRRLQKEVFDGSADEKWTRYAYGKCIGFYAKFKGPASIANASNSDGLCNYAIVRPGVSGKVMVPGEAYFGSKGTEIDIGWTTDANYTLEEFLAVLQKHPMVVYYPIKDSGAHLPPASFQQHPGRNELTVTGSPVPAPIEAEVYVEGTLPKVQAYGTK